MHKAMACLAVLTIVTLSGCVEDTKPEGSQVKFETTLGEFVVETWPDKAPITVENFLQYVHEGHYDGLTFHRIAPGFVVQGGGYLPDHETLRETRDPIKNEASPDVPNKEWTLSMARTSAPDSATSQFFINLADNKALDKTGGSAGYAVFGKVISGHATIEAMTEAAPGRSFGAGGFWPAEPIVINQATIISGATPTPPPQPEPPVPTFACDKPAAREAMSPVDADLITPGLWCITMTEDSSLIWARHRADGDVSIAWQITGAGGAALPDGWSITFDDASATLGNHKSDDEAAYTMAHVTVPAGTNGTFALELHTGVSVTPFTAQVTLVHERLTKQGSSAEVDYAGRCHSDGKQFDSGSFPLTIGGKRAITGFDLGLIGHGENEEVMLHIPAPLAYGYNGPVCAGDEADLIFDVQVTSF